MTVEVDVAVLARDVQDIRRQIDESAADRAQLWQHIEASRKAREDTNVRLTSVEVGQVALRHDVETTGALIRGDVRRVLYGGAATLALVVALLILSLTRGPDAVGSVVGTAVQGAIHGGTP